MGTTINYNQELTSVEKGISNIKRDILNTHNQLEDIFNDYDVLDTDHNTEANVAEDNLDKDITKLLKSKFFKKSPIEDVPAPDLELETDDIQTELQATLGGVYSNVESGVGAEYTEIENTEEPTIKTESASQETASNTETPAATVVESANTPLPEISNPEIAPQTVVAAEGTTGVEAKLAEPTAATDTTESKTGGENGFLQSTDSAPAQ